jgi:hypothetical protein
MQEAHFPENRLPDWLASLLCSLISSTCRVCKHKPNFRGTNWRIFFQFYYKPFASQGASNNIKEDQRWSREQRYETNKQTKGLATPKLPCSHCIISALQCLKYAARDFRVLDAWIPRQ